MPFSTALNNLFFGLVGEDHPGRIVEASVLPRETKDRILFENALEFLGLNKADFFPQRAAGSD